MLDVSERPVRSDGRGAEEWHRREKRLKKSNLEGERGRRIKQNLVTTS